MALLHITLGTTVGHHCQLDWTWSHLGDRSRLLGVSRGLTGRGRLLNAGSAIQRASSLDGTERKLFTEVICF